MSKTHRFTLTVRTHLTKKQAEIAVLAAFAKRNPDNCEFHLTGKSYHKEVWLEGSMYGAMVALDMIEACIKRMRSDHGNAIKKKGAK